jgi:hypothetical protein
MGAILKGLVIVCERLSKEAQATHQAFKGSGLAAAMTTGVEPNCETTDQSAPGIGWPPDPWRPDHSGRLILPVFNQTIASEANPPDF